MDAQNKQQILIFWLWLMLTISLASMQNITNREGCNIYGLESTVDCSGRRLTTLPNSLAINETLTFNFSENALQRFPGGTVRFTSPRLETLDLSNNQIEQFDPMAFGWLPSLKYLHVNHNKLSSIMSGSFINLSNLQVLDISYNNLFDLPKGLWEGLKEVKELLLSSNSLVSLKAGAFHFLKQLEYLDLSANQIIDIHENAFTDLSLLKHLQLYRNEMTEVPPIPKNFRQDLQTLNLSGNPIKTLGPEAFGRLVYLHYLDLSKMDLEYVDPTTFDDLQALNELYLHKNKLQTLQVESIDQLQSLYSLSLINNPWVCNCGLSMLVEYLFSNTSSNINVAQIDSTFCRDNGSSKVPLRGLDSSKLCTFPYTEVLSAVTASVALITIIATFMFCVCRKKRLRMQDAPTSPGIIPQVSPGISQQSSPVTTTNFGNGVPGSSGANSSQSGNEDAVFTTSDHFYSSIKVETPVYCYADSRHLLPQGPGANAIKSPPKRCFPCPLKPGKEKDEAKKEELYLEPIKKPPTN